MTIDVTVLFETQLLLKESKNFTHLDLDVWWMVGRPSQSRNLINQTRIDHYLYEMFKVSWHDQNA